MMVKPEIIEKLPTKTDEQECRPRVKGTSLSSARSDHKYPESSHLVLLLQTSHLNLASSLKGTTSEMLCAVVLIEALYGVLMAASGKARSSLIMFEFSSCLLADSAINLVSDSSRLGLQSGYEEFPLFCWYNPGHAAFTILQVDRVHRTVYSRLLPKFSLLPFVDNLLYSVVPL
ncbi:hypothetical protein Tco_0969136 [Tanacetum coccineum]